MVVRCFFFCVKQGANCYKITVYAAFYLWYTTIRKVNPCTVSVFEDTCCKGFIDKGVCTRHIFSDSKEERGLLADGQRAI